MSNKFKSIFSVFAFIVRPLVLLQLERIARLVNDYHYSLESFLWLIYRSKYIHCIFAYFQL